MSGKTPSLEPDKSTTEQLRTQLTGENPREAIFDFLMANPDTQYSYSEIGDAIGRHKQNVRKHLIKMQEQEFEMNGVVVEGIVYQEKDGRTKVWQLRPEVRDRLDEPPKEIVEKEVERVVEKETPVPRHSTIQSFLEDHFYLVSGLLFLLTSGAVLVVLGWMFDAPVESIGTLLFAGGLVGVLTMTAIGCGETQISD